MSKEPVGGGTKPGDGSTNEPPEGSATVVGVVSVGARPSALWPVIVTPAICTVAPMLIPAARSSTSRMPSEAVPPLGTSPPMSPSQFPSRLRVRSAALVQSKLRRLVERARVGGGPARRGQAHADVPELRGGAGELGQGDRQGLHGLDGHGDVDGGDARGGEVGAEGDLELRRRQGGLGGEALAPPAHPLDLPGDVVGSRRRAHEAAEHDEAEHADDPDRGSPLHGAAFNGVRRLAGRFAAGRAFAAPLVPDRLITSSVPPR